MSTFIYMNHRIREAKPKGAVIRADYGPVSVDANRFEIWHEGTCVGVVVYNPEGNPSKTHEVKAWIEIFGNTQVVPGG